MGFALTSAGISGGSGGLVDNLSKAGFARASRLAKVVEIAEFHQCLPFLWIELARNKIPADFEMQQSSDPLVGRFLFEEPFKALFVIS